MGKATLTFNLPEEQDEFTLAKNGGKYYGALWDISQKIRTHHKYESPKTTKELVEEITNIVNDADLDEVA